MFLDPFNWSVLSPDLTSPLYYWSSSRINFWSTFVPPILKATGLSDQILRRLLTLIYWWHKICLLLHPPSKCLRLPFCQTVLSSRMNTSQDFTVGKKKEWIHGIAKDSYRLSIHTAKSLYMILNEGLNFFNKITSTTRPCRFFSHHQHQNKLFPQK